MEKTVSPNRQQVPPMRTHLLALLVALVPQTSWAQSLQAARAAFQKGNYAEAQETYTDLLKNADHVVPASLGLSHALESEGKYTEALQAIEAALKKNPTSSDLLARKAELLFDRGQWDAALVAARQAIKLKDDCFLARWVVGQVLRDGGDWPKADEEFRWFVRTYTKRSDEDKDISNPEELRLVGLAGLERARYHHLADQYEFILNDLFNDALKNDKLFWQAAYEKGRVYLEKHNKRDAATAFDLALKINPRATEVFVARGMSAFAQMEIKDADLAADQALAINPNHIDALRLKAAVHLFSNENDKAMALLEQARKINPRSEPTLAQIAAVLHVEKKTKEFDSLAADVAKYNPKAWRFNVELGQQLEARKLFLDAEGFFKKAVELEPKMPEGNEELGMLYLRLGNEKEARKLLSDAFDADPFNVRVDNSLKVLDHLEKYKTATTPHYILKFDPKNDERLARFVLHYLEGLHEELAKKFDYQPKRPFLIEIFNKHEMFSGRVVALPDLHTIGACTGRMMAMVSTHDRSKIIGKPFNWVRVLRHEVVHLYNLDQTKFQIPHWFTEGLAVTMEGKATPPSWNYLLSEKLREDDLLNLDNILLGFVRPRSPEQWQQAYLQSQLYVEYMTKTHGEASIGKLLGAYAEGWNTDAALPKALGVKKAEFEKGYRAFIEQRVRDLPVPQVVKKRSLKELKDAYKKMPDDADTCAELAEKHWLIGDGKLALKYADEALVAKANHPLAAYVKAKALVGDKQVELAMATLTTAVDANPDAVKPLKLLAQLQFETKNFASAAESAEKGRKLEPFDSGWLVILAKVYLQTKDEEKLMDVLKSVAASDPDDLVSRRKLADYYDKAKMPAEAERYAWEIMEIDVKDADAQRILIESLQAQNKEEKLKTVKRLLDGD
jgi:Tfp pilus assembly protein PilF